MYQDRTVLCGANSYEEKYYLNPDFEQLPEHVKQELKIMCVLYVHDVGGILTLVYEEDGDKLFLIDQIKIEDDKMNLVPYLLSLKKAIGNLNPIQKKIINDRYYLDKTQFELANEFGISQAQISRIEKNAIKVLKDSL